MIKIILIFLALIFTGCNQGEEMATIGGEISKELVDTNVTDTTKKLDDLSDVSLATGGSHAFVLKTGGALWATGNNSYGQLGDGSTTTVYSFIDTGVRNVKHVNAGLYHTNIVKEDGSLWFAGLNSNGQSGDGTAPARPTGFADTGMRNVHKVEGKYSAVYVIKNNGELWATGTNTSYEFGLGSKSTETIFRQLDTGILDVASGERFSVIIKSDGTVWASGYNTSGQLGLGDTTDRQVYTATGIDDAIMVAAGDEHVVILRSNGEIWGTGSNAKGQLGLGATSQVNVFTYLGIDGVSGLVCGKDQTYILRPDGNIWATGYNTSGQLGLGDTTNRTSFTNTSLAAKGFASNGQFSMGIKSADLSLWSTGYNTSGQLGLGDTTQRTSYTATLEIASDFKFYTWNAYKDGEIVRRYNNLYSISCVGLSPSKLVDLVDIGYINELKPFDDENVTPATHDGSISDMQYSIKGNEEFNAFTLSKVLATSVTYSFILPIGHAEYALWLDGVQVGSGGNGVVKTATAQIDCTRDADGILSLYPTTVIYYAGRQMPTGSTVSIALSHGSTIQLGDFTLNNTVSNGMTEMSFNHTIQDYNDYTPDAFGRIAQGVKPVVTKFSINIHVSISNYDRMVSLHESLVRNFVTIDGSDSKNGGRVFDSLTRRVLITNVTSKTVVTDNELDQYGIISLSAREIV